VKGHSKIHQDGEPGPNETSRGKPAARLASGICLLALSLLFAPGTPAQQEQDILLVRPADSALITEVEQAFTERLHERCKSRPDCPRIYPVAVTRLTGALKPPPRLMVSLGHEASRAISRMAGDTPQLHVLVSRAEHSSHAGAAGNRFAIYLEQPLSRYFELIRFLMPERTRVGILLSEHTEELRERLQSLAEREGMDLQVVEVKSGKQIGKQLHSLKDRVDVLLALPDPSIYNRGTLATILLTTYRDHIPVVGFSAGMVRAGAIAGIHSSPRNIGIEAADAAFDLLQGAPASTGYPKTFDVTVNRRVASALHIRLPTDAETQSWKEGL